MSIFRKYITAENIFFLIGLISIGVMIYEIGLGTIICNIRQTGWWIVPILGVWAIAYFFNTLSAMLIIKDGSDEAGKINLRTLYKITISTFAYNAATPIGLAGGEPYKIMALKRYIGLTKATSSVILFSMMHIVAHFCFWIFSILLLILFVPMQERWLTFLIGVFLVCVLIIYVFFIGYRKGMVRNALHLIGRIPFLRNKTEQLLKEKETEISLIDQQIIALHSRKKGQFYLSLCIEFFTRVFTCSEIYFMFIAMGNPISYTNCILIMAFTSLFANILFFTPLQLGSREGGFLLAFSGLGLVPAWAIAISLITRIRETIWMAIGILLSKIGK